MYEREKALLINFNQGAKLHSSHLWSCHEHQYLYEFSYDDEQEKLSFSYGDEQERIIAVVTNRVYVWQKRHCLANIDCLIKFQKRLWKSKSKYQTIFKKKVKHHLIVWRILILGRPLIKWPLTIHSEATTVKYGWTPSFLKSGNPS